MTTTTPASILHAIGFKDTTVKNLVSNLATIAVCLQESSWQQADNTGLVSTLNVLTKAFLEVTKVFCNNNKTAADAALAKFASFHHNKHSNNSVSNIMS